MRVIRTKPRVAASPSRALLQSSFPILSDHVGRTVRIGSLNRLLLLVALVAMIMSQRDLLLSHRSPSNSSSPPYDTTNPSTHRVPRSTLARDARPPASLSAERRIDTKPVAEALLVTRRTVDVAATSEAVAEAGGLGPDGAAVLVRVTEKDGLGTGEGDMVKLGESQREPFGTSL